MLSWAGWAIWKRRKENGFPFYKPRNCGEIQKGFKMDLTETREEFKGRMREDFPNYGS